MHPSPLRSTRRRGFTLLEIVVCVAILSILAGAAVPAVAGFMNAKAKDATYAEIDVLGKACVEYFRDTNKLPTKLAQLEAAGGVANWAGPYLTSAGKDKTSGASSTLVDGWGQAYTLKASGTSIVVLRSAGTDKKQNTADDITLSVDVTPVRRELTLERLRTINQAVRAYNAQFLTSAPLSPTWQSAFATLVATGYLPNDPKLSTDGWGSVYTASPVGATPVVRFASTKVPGG
jgi:prepilin-type N-terminal cleavage/methylation domain-containing protein